MSSGLKADATAGANQELLDQIRKLTKINAVLMDRVERSVDRQGNAFALFQTAIALEAQVRARTEELTTQASTLALSRGLRGLAGRMPIS